MNDMKFGRFKEGGGYFHCLLVFLLVTHVHAILDVIFSGQTFCAFVLPPTRLVRSACDIGSAFHSFLTSSLLLCGMTWKFKYNSL